MTDSSIKTQVKVAVDSRPQTQTYAEPPPHHGYQRHQPAGPQIWAVVLTIGGLYYLWTRVLGKSLPSFAQRGHRVGANKGRGVVGSGSGGDGGRQAEIRAARERQQQRLQTAARAREMVQRAKDDRNATVSKRPNAASSGNSSTTLTIQQQQDLLKKQQQQKKKQQEAEEKKKKQRQLYLKQKALREKEEEMRKKDEELGPGWRYREDPNATTSVSNLNPQSGSDGGGYKPQKCNPRRGGGGG
eukprot:CAMPEP_0172529550 /NCGR_PEP_ID=MMETSP1067-20121228/3603_1 /TAXON_ID=265564 ORGANISM="Thalassiosira punctigera, Strain Tpunct2005C2" /NCGR_SAMPLE_ID=MMETSP1067 /ASSEMBLY_ACC=CAM_ASM_000444 /LENGTH=242 /DNA_ID=CAMNT_0013313621 /DNA_START=61 /DNA_END=789 /DNA_ORIENTATION=+